MPAKNVTRVVEVYASTTGLQVTLTWRRWEHLFGTAERLKQETRMVRATMPVPLTDEDLTKYVEAMARFCVDPRKRAFRAPNALVWKEVGFGNDVTHEHGEQRDGRPFPMDPLPGFDRYADDPDGATIPMPPEAVEAAPPKAARASARQPFIRKLGQAGKQSIPGG